MLSESWTIPDLYFAVQKVIDLPPVENEKDVRSNLLKLAFAIGDIPLSDRRREVE